MKRIFYSLLITGCLSMLHLLLGACSEDINVENNQVQINGNTATLTFTVGKSDFSSEQINTRSDVSNDTIRQELGDGYVIETVIAPDSISTLTREATSTTNTIRDNVKILVIAYRGENLYKREVATVKSGKFAIYLPTGETFKLLFYSYNAPNQSAPTEYCSSTGWKPSTNASESGTDSYSAELAASIVVKDDETARDMMWATTTLTVTSTTKLEDINFKHLFCKVDLTVNCTDAMTHLLAVIGPQAYSNAKVDISVDPNDDSAKKWIGTGGKTDSKIEGSSSGGTTQLGGAVDLIPDEVGNMTLGYEKITIDGQDYKSSTTIDLNTKLVRGHRYKIRSTIRKNDLVTITYHENVGERLTVVKSYARGTKIELPEDTFIPPLEHVLYTWNTKADGTGLEYENGMILTLTSSVELHAIWKIPSYPVTGVGQIFWNARQPYEGTYTDDTRPGIGTIATGPTATMPSVATVRDGLKYGAYNCNNREYPRFTINQGKIRMGGLWLAHPKNFSTLEAITPPKICSNGRPSNKFLCDYYVFFPSRQNWRIAMIQSTNTQTAHELVEGMELYGLSDGAYTSSELAIDGVSTIFYNMVFMVDARPNRTRIDWVATFWNTSVLGEHFGCWVKRTPSGNLDWQYPFYARTLWTWPE